MCKLWPTLMYGVVATVASEWRARRDGGRGCAWVKFKVAKVNVANLIWATQANLIKQKFR